MTVPNTPPKSKARLKYESVCMNRAEVLHIFKHGKTIPITNRVLGDANADFRILWQMHATSLKPLYTTKDLFQYDGMFDLELRKPSARERLWASFRWNVDKSVLTVIGWLDKLLTEEARSDYYYDPTDY